MVESLGSPQPVFTLPPLSEIPDESADRPVPGQELDNIGTLQLPPLVFGAATFAHFYNNNNYVASYDTLRTARLALRYGIRAFDTSAYYGPSEIVLGNVLKTLEKEFPRSSYKLFTKCGRYGNDAFDYSAATVRASVERSFARLHTDYLDAVYVHDVEFVAPQLAAETAKDHALALTTEKEAYGLVEGREGDVLGEGDRKVLEAVGELRKLKAEGIIKNIGISGYPLPVLLRLALLVLHTPPYEPLDIVLSFGNLTLQNSLFASFAPVFQERAKVKQLVNASPLGMALLTPSPPGWHPAPQALRDAVSAAVDKMAPYQGGLPDVAIGYSIKESARLGMPLVIGLSSLKEVHDLIAIWRELQSEDARLQRDGSEKEVKFVFSQAGYLDRSW